MGLAASYNDDAEGFYLHQAKEIISAGRPSQLTDEHRQALANEAIYELSKEAHHHSTSTESTQGSVQQF